MNMLKILIIEDDEDHAFLEQDVLNDELDCEITVIRSRKDLPEINLDEVDIVLLDFNLPDANGDEVLKELRKSTDKPVIMITGDDHLETAIQTLKNGANDFIVKSPHNLTILPRIVTRVYNEYRSSLLLKQKEKEKDNLNIKIETLRQVLTTLAHYINNSTTTIFGYAQLCEQNPDNADRCLKLAKIGIKETQKITFVIRELENFVNSMEIKTTDYVNIPDAMFEIEENIKRKMAELE
jgi:response regulator RpfG family c-di-GMP phosphodiesterase